MYMYHKVSSKHPCGATSVLVVGWVAPHPCGAMSVWVVGWVAQHPCGARVGWDGST